MLSLADETHDYAMTWSTIALGQNLIPRVTANQTAVNYPNTPRLGSNAFEDTEQHNEEYCCDCAHRWRICSTTLGATLAKIAVKQMYDSIAQWETMIAHGLPVVLHFLWKPSRTRLPTPLQSSRSLTSMVMRLAGEEIRDVM